MEENQEIEFSLYPYQKDAVLNLDEIYQRERVAGAVMPTGAGKSFIALAEMLQINNPNYNGIDDNGIMHLKVGKNGVVNNSKITYVAPTNEIALQIKLDIVEHVLKKNIKEMTPEQINKEVENAFPNLKFLCYQGLSSEKLDLESENADLVILDEVHRSGAPVFMENTAKLLGCDMIDGEPVYNPASNKGNMRVLTISATPERDVDSKDMTKVWSKAIGNYTEEELSDDVRKDLGIRLTLPEAEKAGILNISDVEHFDPNLADTKEYRDLVRIANDEKIDSRVRDTIKTKIVEINEKVLGIPGYDKMNEEERENAKREKNIEVIAKAMKEGKFNIHGKYILFVPHNTTKRGEDPLSINDYLDKKAKDMQDMILEAAKQAGISLIEDDFDFKKLSGSFSDKLNESNLTEFNNKDTSSGKLTFIIASDKLNEGVHLNGVSGSFMTRSISERENTTLRAQSILFLQQQGRTISANRPGETPKEKRIIFDLAGNYYIQNRNGAIDKNQRIDLFELTDSQKMLVDAHAYAMSKIPEKADITVRAAKLFDIMKVLSKYVSPINADIIQKSTTINSLLKNEPFKSNSEEIMQQLQSAGLVSAKKDYKIGKTLEEVKGKFWKNTKFFENYSLQELIKYGVVDVTSKNWPTEFTTLVEKKFINLDGFIQMGASSGFVGYNVLTGTRYGRDGKDKDGFYENQFDPETGKDKDGFYRTGFNDEGIHRDTGTIHDIHGFMANGKNILTGDEYDLAGYNSRGLKPLYNEDREEVGGFDREGLFSEKLEDGTYVDTKSKYATIEIGGKKVSINRYGFPTRGRYNVYTNTDMAYVAGAYFYKDGTPEKGADGYHQVYDNQDQLIHEFDIDGNTPEGFNVITKAHKDTGTRLNLDGKSMLHYSESVKSLKESLSEYHTEGRNMQILGLQEDGMFRDENGKTSMFNRYGFDKDGINRVTGLYTDIYGFNILNYTNVGRYNRQKNKYGFTSQEVPLKVGGKNPRYFYRPYKGKSVNILGTDMAGNKIDGKQDPSIAITQRFLKECIEGDKDPTKFVQELAIRGKMLVPEAEIQLNKYINKTMVLYRICPELAKTDKAKESLRIISQATPDKYSKFVERCPDFETYVTLDCQGYAEELKSIQERSKKTSDRDKLESLRRQNTAVKRKLESLKKLQEKRNDEK